MSNVFCTYKFKNNFTVHCTYIMFTVIYEFVHYIRYSELRKYKSFEKTQNHIPRFVILYDIRITSEGSTSWGGAQRLVFVKYSRRNIKGDRNIQ